MVRVFNYTTLVLVAICFLIGASIAMADDTPHPMPAAIGGAIEAIQPDERMFDESLAAVEDVYEFDFVVTVRDDENPETITHSDILEI